MNKPKYNIKQDGREIGVLLSVVLLFLGLYPSFSGEDIVYTYVLGGFISALIALLVPQLFSPLYVVWMRFSLVLSVIISPVFMGFLFAIVFVPAGVLLRILGKDLLNIKANNNDRRTYWVEKNNDITSDMKRQF